VTHCVDIDDGYYCYEYINITNHREQSYAQQFDELTRRTPSNEQTYIPPYLQQQSRVSGSHNYSQRILWLAFFIDAEPVPDAQNIFFYLLEV